MDTTDPSACYDDRASDRKQLTRIFWAERLPDFNPVISNIVLSEISDTPDEERRRKMEKLGEGFKVLVLEF